MLGASFPKVYLLLIKKLVLRLNGLVANDLINIIKIIIT